MKSDYIFGISEQMSKNGYVLETGRVLLAYNLMLGTPCLILNKEEPKKDNSQPNDDVEDLLKPRTEAVNGIVPFYPSGVRKRVSNKSTNGELKLKSDPSIKLLNRTDLDVVGVDLDKIPKALDFVREKGPLTLFVENSQSTLRELKSFLEFMFQEYPITVGFRFFNNEVRKFKGSVQTAVTIVDVKDVFPIYNTEKVDGVLVDIMTYNEAHLKSQDMAPNHLMELCQVFSKHTENITEIDGQSVTCNCRISNQEVLNFMSAQKNIYK